MICVLYICMLCNRKNKHAHIATKLMILYDESECRSYYVFMLKLYCGYKYTRPCMINRIWGLKQLWLQVDGPVGFHLHGLHWAVQKGEGRKNSKTKKEGIWFSPMTKAPTPTDKSKKQRDNTKKATKIFDYTTIANRLKTVSWSKWCG